MAHRACQMPFRAAILIVLWAALLCAEGGSQVSCSSAANQAAVSFAAAIGAMQYKDRGRYQRLARLNSRNGDVSMNFGNRNVYAQNGHYYVLLELCRHDRLGAAAAKLW